MKQLWPLRLAQPSDVPQLESLITLSVRTLQAPYYSTAQMSAALGPIFGVDRQLIRDATYFVVQSESRLIGCGGWSKRQTLCGSDQARKTEDPLLDPEHDAARIRAFFVHPEFARLGIGTTLLAACEKAIINCGFQNAELLATLAGEMLYAAFGYHAIERLVLPLDTGLTLPVVRMTKRLHPKPAAFDPLINYEQRKISGTSD